MYCDFLFRLKKTSLLKGYIETMFSFLSTYREWNIFFFIAILPELIGQFYSRPTATNSHQGSPSRNLLAIPQVKHQQFINIATVMKTNQKEEITECDNPQCSYEWFYFSYLNLSSKPKSRVWYCPYCRKLPQFKRKTSNRAKRMDTNENS